jgi:RecJ-like exonuclease
MAIDKTLLYTIILEELTRDDKTEIRQLIDKEVAKQLKSQQTKDIVQDEIEKALRKKDTKQDIADITKKVLRTLYKDMSLKHPYMIDRIKI